MSDTVFKFKKKHIASRLKHALIVANGEDDYHRYGEGYTGLRRACEAIIKEIENAK